MKTRLALFLAAIAVTIGLSASVATADMCACGGILVGKFDLGGGTCLYVYDGGPGASPRITSFRADC
jgi:hypothetical protein